MAFGMWLLAYYPERFPFLVKLVRLAEEHSRGFSSLERWVIKIRTALFERIGENHFTRGLLYVFVVLLALLTVPTSIVAAKFLNLNKWATLLTVLAASTAKNLAWAGVLSCFPRKEQIIITLLIVAAAIISIVWRKFSKPKPARPPMKSSETVSAPPWP